jgi:site-specific DNA recombinase
MEATMRRRPHVKRDITNLTGLRVGLYCRVSQDRDGTEKSVDDQEAVGRGWVEAAGAVVADIYRDADRSASRFATREREEFTRLRHDIEAGKLDMVWFWELSRSQRKLGVFADLRDLCRNQGVAWVIRDRVYDPHSYADMMTLGMLSVIGENESELTSERVRRGQASSATAGRPHGKTPYGYRRDYDRATRRFLRQEPNIWDDDGQAKEASPAWVVREIFARFAAGTGIHGIAQDLNDRGIPAPAGGRWVQPTIRQMLLSPTYIARRVYQGEIVEGVTPLWDPLVDEETFWTCRRILSDPRRTTTRPSRARHLLSYLARCGECGGPLNLRPNGREHGYDYQHYTCYDGCGISIAQARLDDYVEEVIVRWLSSPAVFADLTQGGDSEAAAQARADAEQLRADLAEWRQLAKAGKVTATTFAEVEQNRLAGIAEAEQREQDAALPAVLVGNVGPEAAGRWEKLETAVKRQLIREVASIRVRRVGKGQWRKITVADRVDWRWLLGPDVEQG